MGVCVYCLCARMCDFMPSEEESKQVCVCLCLSTIVKEKVSIWDRLRTCVREHARELCVNECVCVCLCT